MESGSVISRWALPSEGVCVCLGAAMVFAFLLGVATAGALHHAFVPRRREAGAPVEDVLVDERFGPAALAFLVARLVRWAVRGGEGA